MYRAKKPLLSHLNEHLVCNICKGYFVDATTIIECLHTFCRSCIVKYLETTKYCPICDVQVHKSKPLLSLRSDKIIQDLVYKLVPRLFNNELQRRKEFYKKHPDAKSSTFEESIEASYNSILTPEEELCLTLNYYGSVAKPRYLRCPSAVSIMHLQKLIRAKFDLTDSHHIDILHNQDCLSPCYTLMDIIYIYKLPKLEPLDLTYRIYEYMAKKMKVENQESRTIDQTDIMEQPSHPNNNNWKEVQLRISENGEMSITGIQDAVTSQHFTPEMIEVIDTRPKTPTTICNVNPVKKKDLPDLKFIGKPSNIINILSNKTIVEPYLSENRLKEPIISSAGNKEICSIVSAVSVPCINAATTMVFSTINSVCSVGTPEDTLKNKKNNEIVANENEKKEVLKETDESKKEEVKLLNDRPFDKGIKRKSEYLNDSTKKQNNVAKKHDVKNMITVVSDIELVPEVRIICNKAQRGKNEENPENHGTIKSDPQSDTCDKTLGLKSMENVIPNIKIDEETSKDSKVSIDEENSPKTEIKTNISSTETSMSNNSNNNCKRIEDINPKTSNIIKNSNNSSSSRPGTPKPSTKYQGPSQPCYMPKTVYSPVINVPKPIQSTSTSKGEVKTSTKSVMNAKNEANCVPSSCSSSVATNSLNSSVTNSKVSMSPKSKSNTPMGYKTLRDPPKSWNSQISKANLNKPQPDPKYSDLKNVRPAKFFKMRNNMLRFLGNPASGVKPMYSVHVSPEKEKVVENREIKKHSIVKIDPKTLKPISEKAPETTSLSSQVSATADLKINTSSVSIFNPLKLQGSSPKSDRKSPKSPQSPKTKSSPSPSPPVLKRDKPNLNFTPPNPFIPNLSSQTVNPNQFLCNSGPPGFPSYDPRVMAAAYHNLFYGPTMGFPPGPLPYHLGGLDINQRGKGFDISKIVGMQQQPPSRKSPVSPQGVSKLEAPTVPPQVPYQPRPSPMSLKSPNSSAPSKRSQKDPSKNEKSLQNTVEKLTLSRAKEIHKVTEILNKSQSFTNAGIAVDQRSTLEVETRMGRSEDDKEAARIPSSFENKLAENQYNKKTSLEELQRGVREDVKKEKPSLVSNTNKNEDKQVMNNTKSENGETQSDSVRGQIQDEARGTEKSSDVSNCGENMAVPIKPHVSDNADVATNSTDSRMNKTSCSARTSDQNRNVEASERTSGDSENNDNNNKTKNEAGSKKLEMVAGNN